jgi:glycosyltransferase involved in cell wall biosynthesis
MNIFIVYICILYTINLMSENHTPVVSIVVPTCNRAKLLQKTINSVLTQTYKEWELIVIDDISTDGTDLVMKEYEEKDKRIKYYKLEPDNILGIPKYLNYGISLAKGKYISRLDDDDYWIDNDVLKIQVNFLDNNPEYVVVGGAAIIVNEKGDHLYKYKKYETDEEIRKNALVANPLVHTTALIRKEALEKIGNYSNIVYAEDWDLWLKLGLVGKMYNFQKYFTCYLSAGQNNSFIQQRPQTKAILGIIGKYKKYYPNHTKGFIINSIQYTYSFLPNWFKRRFHSFMIYLKRNYF